MTQGRVLHGKQPLNTESELFSRVNSSEVVLIRLVSRVSCSTEMNVPTDWHKETIRTKQSSGNTRQQFLSHVRLKLQCSYLERLGTTSCIPRHIVLASEMLTDAPPTNLKMQEKLSCISNSGDDSVCLHCQSG